MLTHPTHERLITLGLFALYLKSSVLDADWALEAFLLISLSPVAFASDQSL